MHSLHLPNYIVLCLNAVTTVFHLRRRSDAQPEKHLVRVLSQLHESAYWRKQADVNTSAFSLEYVHCSSCQSSPCPSSSFPVGIPCFLLTEIPVPCLHLSFHFIPRSCASFSPSSFFSFMSVFPLSFGELINFATRRKMNLKVISLYVWKISEDKMPFPSSGMVRLGDSRHRPGKRSWDTGATEQPELLVSPLWRG